MLRSGLDYPLLFVLVGLLLLLLGRKLFWLFVAVAGFVIGAKATPYILPHQSELFTLLVAILLGLTGAFLAIFLQKVAIAIGGFAVGGYLAGVLCAPLIDSGRAGMESPGFWLCFVIGGILGAVLMMVFFNWALIILSSLQGAHLIIHGLPMQRHPFPILFLILAIIGIAVQASTYRRRTESA
jgi:hypothetical protein